MSDRKKLLDCLSAAEFAYFDTRLFLDTHPTDAQALCAIKEYAAKAAMLREEYEQRYGTLDGSPCNMSGSWTWVCDPWPWDVTKGE